MSITQLHDSWWKKVQQFWSDKRVTQQRQSKDEDWGWDWEVLRQRHFHVDNALTLTACLRCWEA